MLIEICSDTGWMNEKIMVICSNSLEYNKMIPEVHYDHKEFCIVIIVYRFSDVVEGFVSSADDAWVLHYYINHNYTCDDQWTPLGFSYSS